MISSILSAGIVWYFFIPPQFSWRVNNPSNFWSVGLFLFVGYLVSQAQQRLERAQNETEKALKETRAANIEITRLYERTRELDELKTQFFANVSHELRTPLTLILNPVSDYLAGKNLDPELRRDLEIVGRNARLLYRHVTDLLDVARMESGKMPLSLKAENLSRLTRGTVSNFENLARSRNIRLEVEIPDSLYVMTDAEKVQRILLNLLSNSFKFSPEGGMVRVTVEEKEDNVILGVEDNGPGVPENLRGEIFEPFRQVDGSSRRRYGGTGLGLAIVKQFSEILGGYASVSDVPGGGAVFRITLPLERCEKYDLKNREDGYKTDDLLEHQVVEELFPSDKEFFSNSAARYDPLILVVEDNADMAEYLTGVLAGHYRVVHVKNGAEGLEQAVLLRPDLILSDVMMPVMSGDELALALGKLPEMSDIPLVMLTARADDELRIGLLQSGVRDFIVKPFSTDELLARINGIIAESRRAKELLRESEVRFKSTFEQAAVGIAHVAPDGHWLRVNRKLCDITGYSEVELLNCTFQDITHPDDLDPEMKSIRAMLYHEKGNYNVEKRYIRKDGSFIWIKLTVSLVWNQDGTPDYFISVIEDINLKKIAEDKLLESENRYHGILDSMLEGCQIVGFDWKYIYVNEAAAIHGHMDKNKLTGYTMMEMYPGIEKTEMFFYLKRCMDERFSHRMVNEFTYPSGLKGWFELSIQPAPEGIFILSIEITERMHAENRLKENEEKLRLFIEHAPAALAMFDNNMKYIQASNRWLSDYSLENENITGRSHYDIFPQITEDLKVIHRRGLAGEVIKNDEDFYRRLDGTLQWLRWEVRPWFNAGGKIGGIVIFSEDITERKTAEAGLQLSLKQKTELIREIQHRTKNSLQVILSMLSLQAFYARSSESIRICRDMESRVMAMSLVYERLYLSGSISHIDLKDYITDLIKQIKTGFDDGKKRINIIIELESMPVLIDSAVPCGLVVNELVTNSYKHAFPGDSEGEIGIILSGKNSGIIELIVYDNGIGFNESCNPSGENNLGLQIVFNIVEYQLNGTITVEKNPGVRWKILFQDNKYEERV